jgi:hypothetical protein
MSPSGKEHYYTLRELLARAEYRRFRAKNKQNRWADFLGFAPNGKTIIGWFDGSDTEEHFDAEARQWSTLTTYI